MLNYNGIIIEESLEKKDVLKKIDILKTEIEKVEDGHKTPWIKQWTMHTVEIKEKVIEDICKEISELLDSKHNSWYADFKNNKFHYIVFRNKVFKVNVLNIVEYDNVIEYGLSIGIPKHQLDFKPNADIWE